MIFLGSKKGFTLIELLVVISIIGLLSSITLASVNVARSKARDARRLQDMRQIQLALELYKSNTGSYPPVVYVATPPSGPSGRENSCWNAADTDYGVPGGGWTNTLNSLVTANLISTLPVDPINTGIKNGAKNYCYSYNISPSGDYSSCIDIETGQYVYPDDNKYEYALYLSLESTPTKGRVIHWHNLAPSPAITHYEAGSTPSPIAVNSKPYNYCILGPKK